MSMPAADMTTTTRLDSLLAGLADAPPVPVADIASDSRYLREGALFLACRGASAHALDYLEPDVAGRLAAIAWDGDAGAKPPEDVPAVVVPDLRRHLGEIANRWFDTPSAIVDVDAVTGTNGKTTVAWLLARCWQRLGRPAGYVGTLGAGIGDLDDSSGLTTPDAIELQRQLAGFRDAGAHAATLEASSHALAQGRLDGLQLRSALFTNLSRDHIDYHGDMERYGAAKARLFHDFGASCRVVCADDDFGRRLAAGLQDDVVVTATNADHLPERHRYLLADEIRADAGGSLFRLRSSWGEADCRLPLYGRFNVANALLVMAVLLAADIAMADVIELMESIEAPPGRMERVPGAAGPRVFVDYAHTPAALEAALDALRPHCDGRLWCVFGCGGDRDRGKRPEMGAAVARLADCPVLTSDNPRSEDPAAIMRDVQQGMPADVTAIEDRAAAIAWAVSRAAADDIVLIAGKGHESYQQLADRRVPFSDREAAAANLRRRAT